MRLLGANFFPAFHPPRSGGEQRYYYLYHHLSRWHDVTLISTTYSHHPYEVVEFSSSFREHRVPKPAICEQLHWKLGAAGIGPECSAYVVSLASAGETAFGNKFQELVSGADIVIHESPFTLPYDRSISEDGKPRVYNSYNIEHRLARQIFRGEAGRSAVEFIAFLEGALARRAELIFVTSDDEKGQLQSDFDVDTERIVLAPNGFEADNAISESRLSRLSASTPYVVFMGSAHPPNVEAAQYIAECLAPVLPHISFVVMGAVCKAISSRLPTNVSLVGFVDEEEKRRLLTGCMAAINPLFAGAGTNLKMLDYMSAGAPIITTPIGARGLSLEDGRTAFIAEPSRFSECLRDALTDGLTLAKVGEAAREKAFAEYRWESIARRVGDALESALSRADRTSRASSLPHLLVINDFSIVEATGGGQVRIRELLAELGHDFKVSFLCLTYEPCRYEKSISPNVTEIGIPKTAEHRDSEVRLARGEVVSVSDLLAADYCTRNAELVDTFRLLARRGRILIFEHPYMAPLAELADKDAVVVYSSHNVEAELKAGALKSRRDAERWIRRAAELERTMVERAALIVCVSEEDRSWFTRHHPDRRAVVIENGARCGPLCAKDTLDLPTSARSAATPLAVFLGSSHPPNVHAARIIVEELAPAAPEIVFGLVGSVCDAVRHMPRPNNVALFGVISEQEKNAVLRRATIAINPMFEGGGSSLKVPDFLAAGLALISTTIGVRGFQLRDGEDYLRADREESFVESVVKLAGNQELRRRLSNRARRTAETELNWQVLGSRYRRVLRAIMGNRGNARALIVTYRFADPPPGGAEAFLCSILKQFGQRSSFEVDVATCNIRDISNKWHFSAEYIAPERSPASPDYVNAVYRFPVDEPNPAGFGQCARLFALWMAESRAQSLTLQQIYDHPLLLGGWNFPEIVAGGAVRWTSLRSLVYVGTAATSIRLEGFAPSRTMLRLFRGRSKVHADFVCGKFERLVSLHGDEGVIALEVDEPFEAPGDPRQLGVMIQAIDVAVPGTRIAVDMSDDFAAVCRRRDPGSWVASLVDVTKARDDSDDNLFLAVRGPHSSSLERWLRRNVQDYDVVLAQGVPFSTIVMTTDVAKTAGVPVVLLPHFHVEDRYYHWQSFYSAFLRANRVIAAPAQVKSLFLDLIGAKGVAVPGGGIDPSEFEGVDMAKCRAAFGRVHDGVRPYVLVLGRKAAGKNYRMAIEAIHIVNRDYRRDVDLVLIGPDDDGIPVTDAHTFYYGQQPRPVVLGALSRSVCVVNLSDSESFGIVLLEAWCSGKPVIAQRRCLAFSELVRPGTNGVLAESAAEVAEAVVSYLDQPSLAQAHADQGREMARAYTWSKIAGQIEDVMRAVIPATVHPDELCQRAVALSSAAA